jgi:hypothetical protein
MQTQSDLELRVQVLEEMLEVTMAVVLRMATAEQRKIIQTMLADAGRADLAAPALAYQCRRFVADVAVRLGWTAL